MIAASQNRIEQRVRETFERLPLLEGLTFDDELAVVDVELAHWPGRSWGSDVDRDVTRELLDLLEDLQVLEGAAVLKGRTFARTLH